MVEMLRPGFAVCRRDDATLQVGLDQRVCLPDTPDVRAVLSRLETGLPTQDLPSAPEVVAALRARDLVVESTDPGRAARAALATYGPDALRRIEARAAATVSVRVLGQPDGSPADGLLPEPWAREVCELLAESGVAGGPDPDPAADVALLLCLGEPDREPVDGFVVTDQPHLLVVLHEGAARVGPFVVPGTTACLRCLDAHLGEPDDRRGMVLRQLAGRAGPVDPVTARAATALAVRDVVAFLDGERPATWWAATTFGRRPAPEHREWRRHPHCGCCWGDLLDLPDAL